MNLLLLKVVLAVLLCLVAPCTAMAQTIATISPFSSWTVTSGSPKIVLLLVHGFGLHKGAFDEFAQRMQKEQIASYAVDVRGFGEWRDTSTESKQLKFDQSLIDIGSTLLWIRKMHPRVPVVVLGESMGGAFALQATALYPQYIDGLIAAVPSQEFFGRSKAFAKALMQSFAPNEQYDLSPQLLEQATTDKTLQAKWKKDKQARLVISPKELLKFQLFVRKTEELAPEIKDKPVLLLHGTKDRLAKASGTIDLFNHLTTKDKNLVMVGSAEHLIIEFGQFDDNTFNLVLDWLKQHYVAKTDTDKLLL
jgi:alpha-beta hydrolase superfamily lysophospholipase